jgi:hypothetical protein
MSYLCDARCGVPPSNFVDILGGEGIVSTCATYDAYIWAAALAVVTLIVLVVSLTVRVPASSYYREQEPDADQEQTTTKTKTTRPVFSPWFAALPALGAALALCGPFFAVREFRSIQENFNTSGLNKAQWTKMRNLNARMERTADATGNAGLAVAGALLLS